ncbi:MAG TPA: DUF692 family protein [Anaerolineae bacterium]|nr:DUF692 family protein [Anaerolineae bacterium]
MKFGLNYSKVAIKLYEEGVIAPDVFKCPAWPDLISQVKDRYPIYIHFPLGVGAGIGSAIDGETKAPADWDKFEKLLADTGTPYLNLHLHAPLDRFGLNAAGASPFHGEQTLENLIRDVEGVIRRFGKERVIVENGFNLGPDPLYPAYHAEIARQVVEATGCGFLFDISHARIAAMRQGQDLHEYVAQLPLRAIREIHVTGMQVVDAYWLQRAMASGLSLEVIESYIGPGGAWLPNGMTDHLPLSEEDWAIMAWAAAQLRSGAWAEPWVLSLECGGLGPFWEATFTEEEMREQVPRLQNLFQQGFT